MTRTATRAGALLAGALFLAACSGSSPTAAPTQGAAATSAPVATAAPGDTGDTNPSFALPSFHGNVNLEKLLPTSIGGMPIVTQSMTGQDFVNLGADSSLSTVLSALGKGPNDLSIAIGSNIQVVIIAFQVNGVSADQMLTAFVNAEQASDQSTISDVTLGGKQVKKIQPADTSTDPSYAYLKDDIVYSVGGANVTDAVLNEVFSKLP